MTDEEIEELQEKIESQRQEIRAALAEDLGGSPEDYNTKQFVAEQS